MNKKLTNVINERQIQTTNIIGTSYSLVHYEANLVHYEATMISHWTEQYTCPCRKKTINKWQLATVNN